MSQWAVSSLIMSIDCYLSFPIDRSLQMASIDRFHNLFGGWYLSMDSAHNICSWCTMAIDGRVAPSIVAVDKMTIDTNPVQCIVSGNPYRHLAQYTLAGNAHRWKRFTIYGGWQWPSMDTLRNPFRVAMTIDGRAQQSIVAGNGHRWSCFSILSQYIQIVSGNRRLASWNRFRTLCMYPGQ